ncbi:Gfo/Idh/MocA family protein [Vannielia litorea]|uniref:Predicted dehydrogenase n=1 Tax=Vannielia litorea TaxID=1217970 RepID=A0A1N6GXI3_9RHOB|nr:Gfo/Idh/MocA family oxidoreductase [Vannielia litorea]SIO12206.1 Predicted dehydrogenase [Vannielia litorea]
MSAALPLCIIGAGAIGMRHVEVASASPDVTISAIVEPHAPRRAELAAQGLPMVASLAEVPEGTRAAIIASPTNDHFATALACLERGWHVLVEKPITTTPGEARRLEAEAKARGLHLITGHHRRCHPYTQQARAALGTLGRLVGLSGHWSLRKHNTYYDVEWRRSPGAGPVMTNLCHEADLLAFLLGPITEVTALTSNTVRGHVIEDTAALAFRFESGVLGSYFVSDAGASPWSFEASSSENPDIAGSGQDYLRFTGTEGALEFPSLTRWGASAPGEVEWRKPLARTPGPETPRIDPLAEQLRRFAALCAGGTDNVLCTAAEGRAALEVTLATLLSARESRPVAPGEVPDDFRGH